MPRSVAITGIGIVAPCGIGKAAYWDGLERGISCVERDPEMVSLGTRSTVLSRVHDFEPRRFFPDGDELLHDARFIQFGVACGLMAVEDARLDLASIDKQRSGCIMSTAVGGTPSIVSAWERLTNCGTRDFAYEPLGRSISNATCSAYPAAMLMRRLQFGGVCAALSTGCTAGLDAMGLGADLIECGEADLMLCGAAEAPLANISYATLDIIGALAVVDCKPAQSSRPFDAKRGGFVLGEGAAVLLLEEGEHARSRGAHVYAEIRAFESCCNAYHMSDLPDDGVPLARVIDAALRNWGGLPETIGYINAHGSSTPQNDVFETMAYKISLKDAALTIPISSTKSMIGHSLSAASLMGAVAAIGALERSILHPTINYEHLDPHCDLDYIPNTARQANVDRALVTASGFGGIHSCALLERPRT